VPGAAQLPPPALIASRINPEVVGFVSLWNVDDGALGKKRVTMFAMRSPGLLPGGLQRADQYSPNPIALARLRGLTASDGVMT
jgi:hypothetical protein